MTVLAKALYFWRGLATGSVNRRIFSAMVIIAAATVAVKLVAVVKDMVVAGAFGLNDELDAFLIALVIPTFLSSVVAYSFIGAFMPVYIRARERDGDAAARRLFSHVIAASFLALAVLCALLAVAGMPLLKLLAWEFDADKLALTHRVFMLLLVTAVLDGQVALWGAVLNARERFALAALTPILSPVLVIAALVVFPTLDIYAMALAMIVAGIGELVILGAVLARRGLLPLPSWRALTSDTKQVLQQSVPLMLGSLFVSGAVIVDQAMASWLEAGSVAALNYGVKVPAFLCGIGVTALGTAVLPHFSRLAACGDFNGIRHVLRTYTRWILLLSVPLALLGIAASDTLVRLLFERGAFDHDDTVLVSFVQQMYFLQVPFMVIAVMGARLLVAMAQNRLLTLISAVNLALNVVGNLVLMQWLGVAGIALSTSLMYVGSVSMILFAAYRILGQSRTGVRHVHT